MLREKEIKGISGWLMLLVLLVLMIGAVFMLVSAIRAEDIPGIILWLVAELVITFCFFGLTIVNPNEARVVQLFGRYKGSLEDAGIDGG